MARIVCITSGLTGILNASFELVRQLQFAGHEVIYGSPQDVSKAVTKQGFSYIQLPPVNFNPDPLPTHGLSFVRRLRMYLHKIVCHRTLLQRAVASLGMQKFLSQIKEIEPDVILADIELHDHIITLCAHHYNTLLLSQWFSIWRRANLPPLTTQIIPGSGPSGTPLSISLIWFRIQFIRYFKNLKTNVKTAGLNRRSVLKRYARQVKFPANELQELNWLAPFTYRSLPVITTTPFFLEFPHSPRKNLYYVGPVVYSQRLEVNLDQSIINRLQNIFEGKKTTGKSLIFCTLTTMSGVNDNFLEKLYAAVRGRDDWLLIVTSRNVITQDIPSDSANIHVFSWVPQLQVLQHSDCSINHGGIHTINECIHFNVPMLIYSGQKFDQNGCAARVAYHRIGIIGNRKKDSPDLIQQKIQETLTDETIQNNLTEMHHLYHKQKKENRFINLVESLI